MVDISIIPYEDGKAEDVCSVHNSAFKSYINEFGRLYGYRNLIPNDIYNLIENIESNIWLAYMDNEPVGYVHCAIEVKKKHIEYMTFYFVETMEGRGQSKIAVVPSFRKKGIAKALVRHAIEYYQKKGAELAIAFVYNDNELATHLFTKLGFKHEKFHYYDKYSKTEPLEVNTLIATFDLTQPLPKITLNPKVKVRIISKDDLPTIKDIRATGRPGVHTTMEQVIEWFNEGWGEVTLVAEFEGKVVGCMEYNPDGVINILGILPQYRSKGIGTTLFYQLLKIMKERGLPKAVADSMYLPWTEHARKMYKRFNFNRSRDLWVWVKNI